MTVPSFAHTSSFSPLVLADRLIALAQEADRAGYRDSAARLLGLVYAVLDDPARAPSAQAAMHEVAQAAA